jgi:hypothetical protein
VQKHYERIEMQCTFVASTVKRNFCTTKARQTRYKRATKALQIWHSLLWESAAESVSKRCKSAAKALQKRCKSAAKALQKRCKSAAKVLRMRCKSAAKALRKRCSISEQALRKRCKSAAKALQTRCKSAANALQKRCESAAKALQYQWASAAKALQSAADLTQIPLRKCCYFAMDYSAKAQQKRCRRNYQNTTNAKPSAVDEHLLDFNALQKHCDALHKHRSAIDAIAAQSHRQSPHNCCTTTA